MIEYLSESEYERRFDFWLKRAEVDLEMVESCLTGAIQLKAKMLARLTVISNGGDIAGTVRKKLREAWKESRWWAGRIQFQKEFVVGATGPDKNAIPFSHEAWMNFKQNHAP